MFSNQFFPFENGVSLFIEKINFIHNGRTCLDSYRSLWLFCGNLQFHLSKSLKPFYFSIHLYTMAKYKLFVYKSNYLTYCKFTILVLLEYGGTKFIFGFIENNSTVAPTLYVIPYQEKDAFISIKVPLDPAFETITMTIPYGEVTSITLPMIVRMPNAKIGNKGKW